MPPADAAGPRQRNPDLVSLHLRHIVFILALALDLDDAVAECEREHYHSGYQAGQQLVPPLVGELFVFLSGVIRAAAAAAARALLLLPGLVRVELLGEELLLQAGDEGDEVGVGLQQALQSVTGQWRTQQRGQVAEHTRVQRARRVSAEEPLALAQLLRERREALVRPTTYVRLDGVRRGVEVADGVQPAPRRRLPARRVVEVEREAQVRRVPLARQLSAVLGVAPPAEPQRRLQAVPQQVGEGQRVGTLARRQRVVRVVVVLSQVEQDVVQCAEGGLLVAQYRELAARRSQWVVGSAEFGVSATDLQIGQNFEAF